MDRFWIKAAPATNKEGCLLWLAAIDEWGYGRFLFRGRNTKAMRVAWELTYGSIPKGLCVCHTCDTPACINPTHLFLGTHTDNANDMNRKGRHADMRGLRNGRAKLTPKQVLEIRASPLNHSAAGRLYGVSNVVISQIRSRKLWSHVP